VPALALQLAQEVLVVVGPDRAPGDGLGSLRPTAALAAIEEPEACVDHHREESDEDHEPEHGPSVDGVR
jgi:hypothetical protein